LLRHESKEREFAMKRADEAGRDEAASDSFAVRAGAALIRVALLPLWLIALAAWVLLVVLVAVLSIPGVAFGQLAR
jgi:hypothetical protein